MEVEGKNWDVGMKKKWSGGKKREKEEQNKLSSRFIRDTVRVSQKTSVETSSRGAGGTRRVNNTFPVFFTAKGIAVLPVRSLKRNRRPQWRPESFLICLSAAQIRCSRWHGFPAWYMRISCLSCKSASFGTTRFSKAPLPRHSCQLRHDSFQ